MTAPLNTRRTPPYKLAGLVLALITIAAIVLVYFQFRGDFLDREKLTMMSARAGLSMEPGAKVTYNGVEIGQVGAVDEVDVGWRATGQDHPGRRPQVLQVHPEERQRRHQRHHGVRQQVHLLLVAGRPDSPTHYGVRRDRRDVGDHRVQHAVRDGRVGIGAGRPDQAEPDAGGHRRSARRAGRSVRPVDRSRQRDPGRHQSADAPDPRATTSYSPTSATCTPTPRPTCSTGWRTR